MKIEASTIERDQFANEVTKELEIRGWQVKTSQKLAGIEVDLLASKENHATFAIDLVGFPGAMRDAISVNQNRLLSRSQIKNVPLGITEWRTRRQDCLEALEKLT